MLSTKHFLKHFVKNFRRKRQKNAYRRNVSKKIQGDNFNIRKKTIEKKL